MVNKGVSYIVKKFDLGRILEITLLNGSQNKVYKVVTDKGNYVIKEYSYDAINSYYMLKKRKEQIRISSILNSNGINTLLPLCFNNKYFIYFKKRYYLIYNFSNNKTLSDIKLEKEHIRVLAKTQSKIHKLNIQSLLRKSYRKIDIDFEKGIRVAKNKDKQLYELLVKNKDKLIEIVNNCNDNLSKMCNNLCVSHNDYKRLNVMWNNGDVILLDFDATGLSNPSCCLCESAFTFSKDGESINYDFYREYLKSYLEDYGEIKENFKDCLYFCLNGKLQWLKYMMSKNHKNKDNYIFGTICMIKEFLLYYDNIDKFNEIYLELI